MLSFCPDSSSLTRVWINRGFSQCLLRTVSGSVQLGFAAFIMLPVLLLYVFRGHRRFAEYSRASVVRYRFCLCSQFALIIMAILRLILMFVAYPNEMRYGALLYETLGSLTSWTITVGLLFCERFYALPRQPKRQLALPIFCAWVLLADALCIASAGSPDWFFKQAVKAHNAAAVFQLCTFAIEFAAVLSMFGVILSVQGCYARKNQFQHRQLDDSEIAAAAGDGVPTVIIAQGSTFRGIWRKLKIVFPFLWPKGHILLQLRVLFCFSLLVLGRIVNIYVPLFNKRIVNSLSYTPGGGSLTFQWHLIVIYVLLKLAQGGAGAGGGGLLSIVHNYVWIRVQQYTSLEIQVKLYQHIHRLSLRWHLGRKTGEVLKIMDRGTDSIDSLLSYILFSIAPTIFDIIVAIVFFITAFNAWFGLIVLVTMVLYVVATTLISEWRTRFRRHMNLLENETRFKGLDALLNYETVKYYNAEYYETQRYKEAIQKYQVAEFLSNVSLSALNFIQNFIISIGFVSGSLLCAHMVVYGDSGFTVGDYVLFATYIMQLYQPLNYLGSYYRIIQRSFIDMENMFDLLKEEEEVKDSPEAIDYKPADGRIEFRNVSFAYHIDKPVLKNVSFIVEPGKTLALVGPSGSGKSTIVRLLFRFYDPQSGQILYDVQDIKQVTQKSLRRNIGVVPQDTVLFNETILYNIRYGRIGASDNEAEEASKAAEIHDKILTFPSGYTTVVGERGLRLSGGEKQRVAIARTILKSTKFVLLDEATSSLDTNTERAIQASLDNVCVGRTTVIVAHRLSTIIHADLILVLKDGEVIERGRHEELLELENGVYSTMWFQQLHPRKYERSEELGDNSVEDS